mmetsp:Transcript_118377/g.209236  ORF Transcript_118377/g.209236 Transcript_118377/m.209236 type:complete len:106 (+) Transcript_118377:28-345(+)
MEGTLSNPGFSYVGDPTVLESSSLPESSRRLFPLRRPAAQAWQAVQTSSLLAVLNLMAATTRLCCSTGGKTDTLTVRSAAFAELPAYPVCHSPSVFDVRYASVKF